jgi:hypothetical protein
MVGNLDEQRLETCCFNSEALAEEGGYGDFRRLVDDSLTLPRRPKYDRSYGTG